MFIALSSLSTVLILHINDPFMTFERWTRLSILLLSLLLLIKQVMKRSDFDFQVITPLQGETNWSAHRRTKGSWHTLPIQIVQKRYHSSKINWGETSKDMYKYWNWEASKEFRENCGQNVIVETQWKNSRRRTRDGRVNDTRTDTGEYTDWNIQ